MENGANDTVILNVRNSMRHLKKAFNIIYYLVNYNLSNKRILPKLLPPVLIDKTLIWGKKWEY